MARGKRPPAIDYQSTLWLQCRRIWLWQQRHGQHEHQREQAGGSNGNMNLKPSDASGVVHAHRVPMALAIIKTDPMVARMANVIL
jgi:hypothetical protein